MGKAFKTIAMILFLGMFAVPTIGSTQNQSINRQVTSAPHSHYLKIHAAIGTIYAPATIEGCLYTTTSKDFAGLRYNPPVPYCRRYITMHEKNEIA